MKIGKIIELVYRAIPYSDQIRELEIDTNAIYFIWRGAKYKVSSSLMIGEIEGGMVIKSDKAILMEQLIKRVTI